MLNCCQEYFYAVVCNNGVWYNVSNKKYMGNSKTFILFDSMPSFSKGLSRAIDVGNTIDRYKTSESDDEADRKAIRSDWEAVGGDIKVSINTYGKQLSREKIQ